MSVSASIPATVQIRRGHLLALIGVVAALAACITAVVTVTAFNGTSDAVSSSTSASTSVPATITATRKQIIGLSTTAQQTGQQVDPLMSMTPAQLAGVGLGTGYQLPTAQSSPSAADILRSMSPETRRYTESVMNLTFDQLAAGAAGHP